MIHPVLLYISNSNSTITKQIKLQKLHSQILQINEYDFTRVFEPGDGDESNGLLLLLLFTTTTTILLFFLPMSMSMDEGGGETRLITDEEKMRGFVDDEWFVGLEWITPY